MEKIKLVVVGCAGRMWQQIIKQISGNITEEDELIPEVAIKGSGEMWCWDPTRRSHKRIYRKIDQR